MDHSNSVQHIKKRYEWVDRAKGFCTFLVVLMHVVKPNIYSRFCVPFFLVAFFFLSGYVFREPEKISRIAAKLLIQFIVYGAICLFTMHVLLGEPVSPASFIGMFLQVPVHARYPEAVLWFLPCMLVTKLIFCFVYKFTKSRRPLLYMASLFISILGYSYIGLKYPYLPWHLQTACFAQIFFLLGYAVKEHERWIQKWEPLLGSVSLLSYVFLVLKYPFDADLATLYFTDFNMYCIQAFLGCMSIVFLSRCTQGFHSLPLSFFEYMGKYSFFFYSFGAVSRLIIVNSLMPLLPGMLTYSSSIVNAAACTLLLALCNQIRVRLKGGLQTIISRRRVPT